MRPRHFGCRPQIIFVRLILACLLPAAVCLLVLPALAPADVVYFKDGFAVHGKVRSEADLMTDPLTGQVVQFNKGNNFIIDDRVRFVMFSHRIVQEPDPEVNIQSDFIQYVQNSTMPQGRLPGSARIEKVNPFDDRWQRLVMLRNEQGPWSLHQRLTLLTPYAARVETQELKWRLSYMTQELGLDTVKKLLDTYPDPKGSSTPTIESRLRRFRFLMQGGWLLAAEEELNQAATEFPAEKDRIERSRTPLKQAKVQAFWDEIETAHKAGRHRYVAGILRRLPINELDSRTAAAASSLRTQYETWDQQTKDVYQLLNVVSGRLAPPPRPVFTEALAAIRAELCPENLDRLEAFRTLGLQHEQELKAGREPAHSDADILALAITGWVLGRESAEPSVATAERLWASRTFTLNYLRNHDASARHSALEEYQRQKPLALDEMTQLIALLPPPEPAALPAAPNGLEERETQLPSGGGRKIRYALQLPPEYKPNRPYPLLIALASSGEPPLAALAHWSEQAARNGYILVAPLWAGVAAGYGYTVEEQSAVTDLVLDLRRRYAVDSDRVFLTGYAHGATMAFDVGMSHPDLFAGVLPINGLPKNSASIWYWRNAQYLPFYIVAGEYAGEAVKQGRFVFENFLNRGYPSLMTIYQGRPDEFYQGEVPIAIDWMNRKKRATGFPELGRNANSGSNSEEFQTMRSTDNRFYWITAEEINDRNLNKAVGTKTGTPAAFTAQIRDGNVIIINSRGIKRLRVWLGRVWDPQSGARSMIDFSKPVRINLNRVVGRERMVTPSLATMLEDLYQRGDRQRLFMAYVDLNNLQ